MGPIFKGPLGFYAAYDGSLLLTFRVNLWDPSSMVFWDSSSIVLWDFTQRRMLVSYRRFETTYGAHLQGSFGILRSVGW